MARCLYVGLTVKKNGLLRSCSPREGQMDMPLLALKMWIPKVFGCKLIL